MLQSNSKPPADRIIAKVLHIIRATYYRYMDWAKQEEEEKTKRGKQQKKGIKLLVGDSK